MLGKKVPDQKHYVVAAFAQRWHFDREYVEPVIQVSTKGTIVNERFKIAVRRGQHSDIDLDRSRRAKPLDLSPLQHTQKLGLQFERYVSDFVEENRSVVRQLKASYNPRERASERSLFVAEQLALDQGSRQGGTVNFHHSVLPLCASSMNRSCHQLLACSCFANDQDSGIGRSYLFNLREDLPDASAVANDLFKIVFQSDFVLKVQVLGVQTLLGFSEIGQCF